MQFHHIPVLLDETINFLNINPDGVYVDGTLGGAGHSLEICKRITKGKLIGIDQDIEAVNTAKERLKDYSDKIIIVNDNFKNLKDILYKHNIKKVDGILLDIGVSSYQLDQGTRGFSYQIDALLDMRMSKDIEITAKDILNTYSKEQLTKLIRDYGEENWAKRIAEFIVEYRQQSQIETTTQLVEIIKMAIPASARREGPHPAKRTFQAIRIEVNKELDVLKVAINDGIDLLKTHGRMCIITFHSLEDRIVKDSFANLSNPCTCPPQFPICICNKVGCIKNITKKPVTASSEELISNPRARSAKLRVAEKL